MVSRWDDYRIGRANRRAKRLAEYLAANPIEQGPPGPKGDAGNPGGKGDAGAPGVDAEAPRRARVAYAGSDLTWTYPTAFAANVVPIIEVLAEVPSNYTGSVNAQVVGEPTNVSCKIRANAVPAASLSLVGLVNLTLFQQAPNTIKLHLTARSP